MNDIILKQLDESNKKSGLISEIVEGIILSRSVSSSKCANYISGRAKRYSKIKRVERFYARGYLNQDTSAMFMLGCIKGHYFASMDRTNWKHGSKDINALVVYGVSEQACSMLNLEFLDNKGGCSNFNDRVNVLEPVVKHAKGRMLGLLCDREFFSLEFVDYLITETGLEASVMLINKIFHPFIIVTTSKLGYGASIAMESTVVICIVCIKIGCTNICNIKNQDSKAICNNVSDFF